MFHLNQNGLWLDEGFSVASSKNSVSRILSGLDDPAAEPGYYLALHFWIDLFGDSERAIRALSVIFGAFGIIFMYFLGKEIYDPPTGLIASGAMSFFVFPVHYSQEARFYALFMTATILAMFYFIRAISGGKRTDWIAYTVCSAALCYIHNYWIFVSCAQLGYLLFARDRQNLLRWLAAQFLALFLFLPAVVHFVVTSKTIALKGSWMTKPAFTDLLKTIRTYVTYLVDTRFYLIFVGLAAIALIQPLVQKTETKYKRIHVFLLLWFMCPIVLPFLLSLTVKPIFLPRYTSAAVPALFLLCARGIMILPAKVRPILLACCITTTVFSLNAYFLQGTRPSKVSSEYALFPIDRWREFVPRLISEKHPKDAIMVTQAAIPVFSYYSKAFEASPVRLDFPKINRTMKVSRRIWLIIRFDSELETDPFVQFVFGRCRCEEKDIGVKPTYGSRIFLCRSRAVPAANPTPG